MRLTTFAASIAAIVVLLAACGGGGGSDSAPAVTDDPPVQTEREATRLPFPLGFTLDEESGVTSTCLGCPEPHYTANFETLPRQTAEDAQRAPVYSESSGGKQVRKRLFVGIHQGDDHLGSLPSGGERGRTQIRYGRLNDGVGAATVAAYLEAGLLSDGRVRRHASPPVLSISGTVAPHYHYRDSIVRAVQLVNAALPDDWQITILPGNGDHDSANIEVEFVPSIANASGITHYFVDRANPGQPSLDRARIEIERNVIEYAPSFGRRLVQQVLQHEIIHALGVLGHLPTNFDTVMEAHNPGPRQGIDQPLSILYPADREAVRALYSRLENGDSPAADLGPWSSTSVHLAGNGKHANFGVAVRNGYAEPWAHGFHPGEDSCCDFSLARNPELSGLVTWEGTLLGFSGRAPVVGDAEIGVNLATLTGTADFTGLETWVGIEGTAPGAAGTGITWLDGDLDYTIAVRGNTFRETGGDDGRLTGIFTGSSHEGAAGTLERSDLTAAFGASRE